MVGHQNSLRKKMLQECPQQFVTWILQGAILSGVLPRELKRKSIYADALFRVVFYGQLILLYMDGQSTRLRKMAWRLLEYGVQASLEHGLSVYPVVICQRKSVQMPESPLIWKRPDCQEVLRFNFLNSGLWKRSPPATLQDGLDGLLL